MLSESWHQAFPSPSPFTNLMRYFYLPLLRRAAHNTSPPGHHHAWWRQEEPRVFLPQLIGQPGPDCQGQLRFTAPLPPPPPPPLSPPLIPPPPHPPLPQVESVYRRRMSIYLGRIEKSKKNGSTAPIPVHASNLMLKKVSSIKSAVCVPSALRFLFCACYAFAAPLHYLECRVYFS